MANRYSVVLRTYPRRLLVGSLFLLFFLIGIGGFGIGSMRNLVPVLLINLNLGVFLFAAMMAAHVKEQFADSRAALVPGFGAPHLAVAAAISIAMLALTTVVICWRAGTSISGTAAAVLVPFTAVVWGVYSPSLLPITVLSMFVAGITSAGRLWYAALLEGRTLPIAVVLLVMCLTLLVILGARLLRLNEDMSEYRRLLLLLNPAKPEVQRRMWAAWQGHWQTEWQPGVFDRRVPARRAGAEYGFWERVLFWRAGMSPFNLAMIIPFIYPFGIFPCFLLYRNSEAVVINLIVFPVWYEPVFLGSVLSGLWLQRWPRLGYELLRPTTRRTFCREMGLAFALDLFEAWLWNMLSFGFVVAVLSPRLLRGTDIAVFLCLTGLVPFVQWAVSAVVLSCSRSGLLLLIPVVVVSLSPGVLCMGYFKDFGPTGIDFYLSTALGVLLLCLVTLYLAYRRWLNLDLA